MEGSFLIPTTPPPDLPSGIDPKLADYLRRLNTWAFQQLEHKVPLDSAIAALHFLPSDQKPPTTVLMMQVNSAGTLQISQMPLGGGQP